MKQFVSPTVAWLWLASVALVPTLMGANKLPSVALLAISFSVIALMTSISHTRKIRPLGAWVWGVLLVLFGWVGTQLLPSSAPSWGFLTAELGVEPQWFHTLDVVATFTELGRWLVYGLAFWLAYQWGHSKRRAERFVQVLAVIGSVYAIYGLLMIGDKSPRLLFWAKEWYPDSVTGTFINHNTYATYAGVASLCSLLWLRQRWLRLQQVDWRKRFNHFSVFLLDQLTTANLLPLFCLVANLSGLLMSHSRAGLVAFIFGLLIWLVLTVKWAETGQGRWRWVLLGGFMPLVTWLTVSGSSGTIGRFMNHPLQEDGRLDMYRFVLKYLAEHPWTGSGLGTFQTLFYRIREPEDAMWTGATVSKVHNTYLQLAMEIGIPATLLIILLFGWVISVYVRGLQQSKSRRWPALGLAVSGLAASHALVDFSFEIPGFMVVFMSVIGVTLAQTTRAVPARSWPVAGRISQAIIAMMVLAVGVWVWQGSAYQLTYYTELRQLKMKPEKLSRAQLSDMQLALQQAAYVLPLPQTQRDKAIIDLQLQHQNAGVDLTVTRAALRKALRLNPYNPFMWMQLAHVEMLINPTQMKASLAAWQLSLITGPVEPQLLNARTRLGFAWWPRLTPLQQALVRQQYTLLKKYKPWKAAKLTLPVNF